MPFDGHSLHGLSTAFSVRHLFNSEVEKLTSRKVGTRTIGVASLPMGGSSKFQLLPQYSRHESLFGRLFLHQPSYALSRRVGGPVLLRCLERVRVGAASALTPKGRPVRKRSMILS